MYSKEIKLTLLLSHSFNRSFLGLWANHDHLTNNLGLCLLPLSLFYASRAMALLLVWLLALLLLTVPAP